MTVTINDVAKKANVSIGVVSAILNNKTQGVKVSDATKRRVIDIVAELGYYPNVFSRYLRTNKSFMIGVLLSDICDPYYGNILKGIESECVSRDYHYLLSGTEEEGEGKPLYLEIYRRRGVDGIITAGTTSKVDDETLLKFVTERFPLVLLNRRANFLDAPSILVDNLKGSGLAVEYLIQLEHKNIGYVRGEIDRFDSQERWQGYKDTLERHDLRYDEELVVNGDHTLQGGYKAMKELLSRNRDITAVYTFNDMSAIGAMKACKEKGLRIPEDISIVGFDDIAVANFYDPSLTTIKQPTFEMGENAVGLLITIIEGRDKETFTGTNREILFEPELVIRGSTGVCRR